MQDATFTPDYDYRFFFRFLTNALIFKLFHFNEVIKFLNNSLMYAVMSCMSDDVCNS